MVGIRILWKLQSDDQRTACVQAHRLELSRLSRRDANRWQDDRRVLARHEAQAVAPGRKMLDVNDPIRA